jgi:preprotein translocase subunit SecG
MGDVFKKVKRIIAQVLIVIAVVLVAVALIYWGNPDLAGSFLAGPSASSVYGASMAGAFANMTPMTLAILGGAVAALAYIIDAEAASGAVDDATQLISDVAAGAVDIATDVIDEIIPKWLQYTILGVGAYLLYDHFIADDGDEKVVKA